MDDLFGLLYTTPVHKRRVAIRNNVRESYELEADCDHKDWNRLKEWCNGCGITIEEIEDGSH